MKKALSSRDLTITFEDSGPPLARLTADIGAFLLAVDDAPLDTDAATMAFLLAVYWWRQINKYTSINHILHGN
jgi:hypothetical protein